MYKFKPGLKNFSIFLTHFSYTPMSYTPSPLFQYKLHALSGKGQPQSQTKNYDFGLVLRSYDQFMKNPFLIIEWFLSYLPLLNSKKASLSLIKVENFFFFNGPQRVSKKRNFADAYLVFSPHFFPLSFFQTHFSLYLSNKLFLISITWVSIF